MTVLCRPCAPAVDDDGRCPNHPFVQIRRRSPGTGRWRSLLDACPVCKFEKEGDGAVVEAEEVVVTTAELQGGIQGTEDAGIMQPQPPQWRPPQRPSRRREEKKSLSRTQSSPALNQERALFHRSMNDLTRPVASRDRAPSRLNSSMRDLTMEPPRPRSAHGVRHRQDRRHDYNPRPPALAKSAPARLGSVSPLTLSPESATSTTLAVVIRPPSPMSSPATDTTSVVAAAIVPRFVGDDSSTDAQKPAFLESSSDARDHPLRTGTGGVPPQSVAGAMVPFRREDLRSRSAGRSLSRSNGRSAGRSASRNAGRSVAFAPLERTGKEGTDGNPYVVPAPSRQVRAAVTAATVDVTGAGHPLRHSVFGQSLTGGGAGQGRLGNRRRPDLPPPPRVEKVMAQVKQLHELRSSFNLNDKPTESNEKDEAQGAGTSVREGGHSEARMRPDGRDRRRRSRRQSRPGRDGGLSSSFASDKALTSSFASRQSEASGKASKEDASQRSSARRRKREGLRRRASRDQVHPAMLDSDALRDRSRGPGRGPSGPRSRRPDEASEEADARGYAADATDLDAEDRPPKGDCDARGRCARHPHVQLRKKKLLGGWKAVLTKCPDCRSDELREMCARMATEERAERRERNELDRAERRPKSPREIKMIQARSDSGGTAATVESSGAEGGAGRPRDRRAEGRRSARRARTEMS